MIRYDKKFNNEINKVVRNFNSKIKRLEKAQRDLILPETITVKELKSVATSRNDLKRKLASLKRFNTRGIENTIITEGGVKTSRYELAETERALKSVKQRLTKKITELENITPTMFGRKASATLKQMGSVDITNLKARKKSISIGKVSNLSKEEFSNFKKLLESNIRKLNYADDVFMYNYIDEMIGDLAYQYDYDTEKIRVIKEKLMYMTPTQFYKMYKTESAISEIVDFYQGTTESGFDPRQNQKQVFELFDNLYDSINDITKEYVSESAYKKMLKVK